MLKASKMFRSRGFDRRFWQFSGAAIGSEPALWSGGQFSIWTSWALFLTMLGLRLSVELVFGGMFYDLSNGALGLPLTWKRLARSGDFLRLRNGFSAL